MRCRAPALSAIACALCSAAILASFACDSRPTAAPNAPAGDAADGGRRRDAEVTPEAGGRSFAAHKLSECEALPAQPAGENTDLLLVDCARTLGTLRLGSGKYTPFSTYEGALSYVAVAGDYVVFLSDNHLRSVSLRDGTAHDLVQTSSPMVFSVSLTGRYVLLRGMRNSNALLAVAVDGSAPAIEVTSSDTEKHRLQGAQDRLLYTKQGKLVSVDLANAEATELGPAADSLLSGDGGRVAFIDHASSQVIVSNADGSERRAWDAAEPKATFLVAFTRDAKQLAVRHEGGMRLLTLDSGEWTTLAAPPSTAVMQIDMIDDAIVYQYALGGIEERSGVFRDGFGLSAVPLNGDPSVMLSKVDSSYFRDFVWHTPGSFSADLAELIYPTLRHGLVVVDLENLTTRALAAVGCGEGAAGFSPDRQALYYWVCDPSGKAVELYALGRDGETLAALREETRTPLRFASDSKHFAVQGNGGFWLSGLASEHHAEFFAMDTQTLNMQGQDQRLASPFFPFWRDAQHLVYNNHGVYVITLP